MSDLPIKITLKSGTGYDAPWVTVDAADPYDAENKLGSLLESNALQKVVEVAELFKAANNVAPLTQPEAPAPQQQSAPSGWGNRPQQQASQQGGSHPNAQLHPEGKACEFGGCGKVLEFKKTQGGKGKFQCPDWRWNNGNPNGHTMEWQN